MGDKTLYIALDESGRGQKTRGEIIVAYFSTDEEDAKVRIFPRGRKTQFARETLASASPNYYFTCLEVPNSALEKNRACLGESNLVLVAPYLVDKCLREAYMNSPIRYLHVFFDGHIDAEDKEIARDELSNKYKGLYGVVIRDFKKNGRRFQSHSRSPSVRCPLVGYLADLRAHALYEWYFQLAEFDRRVKISEEELARRESRINAKRVLKP